MSADITILKRDLLEKLRVLDEDAARSAVEGIEDKLLKTKVTSIMQGVPFTDLLSQGKLVAVLEKQFRDARLKNIENVENFIKKIEKEGILDEFSKALSMNLTRWEFARDDGEALFIQSIVNWFKNASVYRFFGSQVKEWEKQFSVDGKSILDTLIKKDVLIAYPDSECDACGGHVMDGMCMDCGEVSTRFDDPDTAYLEMDYSRGKKYDDWVQSR